MFNMDILHPFEHIRFLSFFAATSRFLRRYALAVCNGLPARLTDNCCNRDGQIGQHEQREGHDGPELAPGESENLLPFARFLHAPTAASTRAIIRFSALNPVQMLSRKMRGTVFAALFMKIPPALCVSYPYTQESGKS